MTADTDLLGSLHSIMKKLRKMMDRELFSLGMGHTEMRLLMILYNNDGCQQEKLGSQLEVDRSNVGRALKKLEELGYVKRQRDDEDGRAYKVFLTKSSWAVRDQVLEIRSNLKKTLTRGITAKELKTLAELLRKADGQLSEKNYRTIKHQGQK